MIINLKDYQFYVKPGHTDMRKQFNGLIEIIHEEMELDPFNKSLFLFCNRQRNRLKIIYWDNTGFCLWFKRLEKAKFPWPANTEESMQIGYDELQMLLNGIDFFKAHKKLSFSAENLK